MKRYLHFGLLAFMTLCLLFLLFINIYRSIDYPKIKSAACLGKFTPEELDFFVEVGFLDSYEVKKWVEDIRVTIEGNPMPGDELTVDSIIEELKPLIYPVKMYRSKENTNLTVLFTGDQVERQAMGVTLFPRTMVFSAKIKNAEMKIYSNVKGQARQACIRHEFLHALGLTHPSQKNTNTIIESHLEYSGDANHIRLHKYTDLDKSSLQILYNQCLPVGLKKKTFVKAVALKKRK